MNETEMKNRLKKVYFLYLSIEQLQECIAEIDTQLESVTQTLNVDIVQTSKDTDKNVVLINKKFELMKQLQFKFEKRLDLLSELENEFIALDDLQLEYVLRSRYIMNKSFDTIAQEMHFSVDYVFKLHKKALLKLALQTEETIKQ